MTVYEQELRKLFEHSNLVDQPQFSGRVCVGDLGKDLRVRAEFLSTHISSQYDAIRLTVLNRTEGVVDRTLLRFQDVWGKKQMPNNPNFRSGVIPHLWDDYGKVEWYAYHPTAADYAALRDAVGQYLSAFRERTPELERSGPKLVYICAPLRGDVTNNVEFARQKAQEVFVEGNTQQSYYQQIRAISDRLCREHGLSVIVQGAPARSVSYIEWLRQSRGQPTFRSMLEADLHDAIRDANDLGHFFLLMEHKGYEIHHGGRLGFRLRGQERFQYPGRRDPLFTEDGIRAAIQGNLEQIEAGLRPVLPARLAYQPYRKHPRYSGFLALYVHYLYLLGKIEKRQYPPRMTPHLRQAVMRFERYQAQFAFLRENNITTPADMAAFEQRTEETLGRLTKQRTLLNVRKKKRQPLYAALADAEALEPSRALYEEGLTGMEREFEQYMKAVKLLEVSGIPQEVLKKEKAEVYEQLSEVNRKIRAEREKLKLCREICQQTPVMEQDIQKTEEHQKEVREHEHRRR